MQTAVINIVMRAGGLQPGRAVIIGRTTAVTSNYSFQLGWHNIKAFFPNPLNSLSHQPRAH